MTEKTPSRLDRIWIRYRIPMRLYLRLKLLARREERSMSVACVKALASGLRHLGVPDDNLAILGPEETPEGW